MNTHAPIDTFAEFNRGYARTFRPGGLTLGVVAPVEAHGMQAVPDLQDHLERIALADQLGFAAVWLRDVPFNVPSFGDAGQTFDPFTYLGALSMVTRDIALGIASVILPLRHPAHVAKAAASADQLSGGRLILGVASGDRPGEYPAMNQDFEGRAERFRDAFAYIKAMAEPYPVHTGTHGALPGDIDMLPKPVGRGIPLLVTGSSRQDPAWVAQNSDGWITYPRSVATQAQAIDAYRAAADVHKPVMHSLYIDLVAGDPPPVPIHLGFRSGLGHLARYLEALQEAGVNHVALNLRFNQADVPRTLERLSDALLPQFPGV